MAIFGKLASGKLAGGMTFEAALRDARSASSREARLIAIAALADAAGDDAGDDGAVGRTERVERAARLLRELLGEQGDGEIRQAAALACGDLGDARALTQLRALAIDDASPAARQGAVIALGQLGDGRDAAIVRAALEDADADVRFQAVGAIAELAGRAPAARDVAEAALPARLADDDAEVRGSAAAAIGDLALHGAKDSLLALLQDDERATRLEAAVALSRLDDERGAAVLAENVGRRDVGLLAAEALYLRPRDSAREAMNAALDRTFGDPVNAVYVAGALLKLGDSSRARARLLKALQSRKDPVRALAIQIAGELGEPWSLDALRALRDARAGARWRDEIDAALAHSR